MYTETTFANAIDLTSSFGPLYTCLDFNLNLEDVDYLLGNQLANFNENNNNYYDCSFYDYYDNCLNIANEQFHGGINPNQCYTYKSIGPISHIIDNGKSQSKFSPQSCNASTPLQNWTQNYNLKIKTKKHSPRQKAQTKSPRLGSNYNEDAIDSIIAKVRSVRVKLGFTQSDLATSMKKIFGRSFSQTTVCRFEGKQLTQQNMIKLFPLFEKWLIHFEKDETLIRLLV